MRRGGLVVVRSEERLVGDACGVSCTIFFFRISRLGFYIGVIDSLFSQMMDILRIASGRG